MKAFDVISVGNAMLDVFLTLHEPNPFVTIRQDEKKLCFAYGEKIHVDHDTISVGGNASNVAVAIERQGLRAGLMAEIGDDEFSQKILHVLEAEHLDTSLLVQTKGSAASFSVGITIQGERTLFVDHVKREHNFTFSDLSATWVYLTSLGVEWKTAYASTLSFVKETGCKFAFSPGTHQFEELAAINNALLAADILFVNKEEAARIAKSTNSNDIKNLLHALQQMGPKVVSITDGSSGSFAITREGMVYQLTIFQAPVIGKTGSGDAYASGFLGAVIAGKDVLDAMRWGAINAASVVSHIGAQKGLLSKEAIEKTLAGNPTFQSKQL